MSSYHSSFDYLGKNSAEQGYIIAAFEPDEGFKDTFLGMDQISEDYYDGTKKFLYGTRYNSTAVINITLVKMNGTDFTVNDNRNVLRWLTGARTASWLDLYQGDKIKYSFIGTVTSSQQYKLDGRIVGIQIEFSSITPWAYSAEDGIDRSILQKISIDTDGTLIPNEASIDANGVLCNGKFAGESECFLIDDNGVIFVSDKITANIDNKTDDPYSYVYLDIDFENDSCKHLEIRNETLNETTKVNLKPKEIINITNKQFIVAYKQDENTGKLVVDQNRVFGDDFNFVWPRLTPGRNYFEISGDGNGTVKFAWRYPIKIGDCAMDISTYGSDAICDCPDNIPSYDTIRWQDITGIPTSLAGYGITDAYTQQQADQKITDAVKNKADKATTLAGYGIGDAYTDNEVDAKLEDINEKIDNIEINGGTGTGGSITIDENELNEMLQDILG